MMVVNTVTIDLAGVVGSSEVDAADLLPIL